MKAKRIVSILLTGSMLLSLLPVSALAATPVFDAPAQTTAKKAAPLVQEADASRSTEEEAATRSSRDLDAENGTADSFTIQLNAEGHPESEGDSEHWAYGRATSFNLELHQGTFTLQPSSEAEAESALWATLNIYKDAEFNGGTVGGGTANRGIISGGTFQGKVENHGAISDGAFQGTVENYQTISGGTFQERVGNWAGGTISGGTFQGDVDNNSGGTISGGTFQGTVQNDQTISGGIFQEFVSNYQTISGGTFLGAVDNYDDGTISGGYFVTMPEGSDTGFAAVSDQADRPFHVPVNDGFSESYSSLYVPRRSSEQPNTITVKTNTKLTDCLADSETIMSSVVDKGDNTYEIPVQNYEKIVLVTEEPVPPTPDKPTPPTPDKPTPPTPDKPTPPTPDKPVPPTPDKPGDEIDPAFSSGAAVLGAVLGTAGLGYATYVCGSSLYLHYVLPGGFIPSTRQELATVLWTTAGKPDPVSIALYTDIPADAIEQQKAARWCAEQGLLSDHGATFGPDTKVTHARIIRAWNSLKKVPVTITK